MDRVRAEFADQKTAFRAVKLLVAESFPVEALELRALRPDGTSPEVPVQERSHIVPGFLIGGLAGATFGVGVGVATGSMEQLVSFVAFGGGVGAAAGGAIGIGSWAVNPSARHVPDDATGFVVVAEVPEPRAEATDARLRELGGRDSTPRLVSS